MQGYARSTPPPILEIQWTSPHERDRWRAADLAALDAQTVVLPLSKHSVREVRSGVRLADLLAKRGAVDTALLEVRYGLLHKKTLRWQELDADQTIVVFRRNGSRLDALWLMAVDIHSRPITIKGVTKVVVKTSSR